MIDIAINEDPSSDDFGDIYLDGSGDLATVEDSEAIDQGVRLGLRLIKGEWFLDENAGLDYFGRIFEKGISPSVIAAILKAEVLSNPGIISVETFELDFAAGRALTVSFTATKEDGTTTDFNEVLR